MNLVGKALQLGLVDIHRPREAVIGDHRGDRREQADGSGEQHVVEGSGCAWLNHKPLTLAARDIFVVPSWTTLRFEADSTLVLFGYSDRACQEKLNLYREENA